MHVIVAGGGRVGAQTAVHLSDDRHTVTVVENDEATVQGVPQREAIDVVVGDAVSPETFDDVFAGLTGDTNANIVACYIARSGQEALTTIVRIGTDSERRSSQRAIRHTAGGSCSHADGCQLVDSGAHQRYRNAGIRLTRPTMINTVPRARTGVIELRMISPLPAATATTTQTCRRYPTVRWSIL
jgi:hypothetical protein